MIDSVPPNRTRYANCSAVSVFLMLGFISTAHGQVDQPAIEVRPRIIVLTDYFKDPDDKQSMIRLLVNANEFDIEGLIATSLAFGDGARHPDWIHDQIDEYAKVFDNLCLHARDGFDYPSPKSLHDVVKEGAPIIRKWAGRGRGFQVPFPQGERDSRSCEPATNWIGEDKDTEASRHIINVVDSDDPRPVWICVWGGAIDLSQAIWRVRHDRSPYEAEQFINKLRVYQINWQDKGAVWNWTNVPELFLVQATELQRGMYTEGKPEFRNDAWVTANITSDHGPLGAHYPKAGSTNGIKEGDTPSFLHLLAKGLSDPEHPEWGGWGGRFQRHGSGTNFFVDSVQDAHPENDDRESRIRWTIGRWNRATANDFAARLDWCVQSYDAANHHPIVCLNGDTTTRVLRTTVKPGDTGTLDARETIDPDGDKLSYRWWHYREAGSYDKAIEIDGNDNAEAKLIVPNISSPTTVHVVLEVTDDGAPPLTAYRRLIVEINPEG